MAESPKKKNQQVNAKSASKTKTTSSKKIIEDAKFELKTGSNDKLTPKKILFVASEAAPFSRTGGLGDVAGVLPEELNKLGNDCRVVTPYYSTIPDSFRQTMKFIGKLYVPLGWRNQYCGIFEFRYNGVIFYFLDNEYYFKRDTIYGQFDDGERFAFFSKACLEMLQVIDFVPDVIHANDWQTALVPVFIDTFYRFVDGYKLTKTLFTIHNIEYQGHYDSYIIGDILGIPDNMRDLVMNNGDCNFMKGAIESANLVTTVSKSYAEEIKDKFYSYGLDSILINRSYKIRGVVNGIDTTLYDPETDKFLFQKYGVGSIELKKRNKEELCKMLDLHYDENKPMIAMITRLADQKGLDLVAAVAEELLSADIQFVVLGTGNWKYETLLTDLERRYNGKCRAIIKFSQDIASKIYAAADIFLMPSKFEPCGLSQMIAMRYGTVPVVRETGGLRDTVIPFDFLSGKGNGFTFKTYNAHDMLNSLWYAIDTFYNKKDDWKRIMINDMIGDYSWQKSAMEYEKIYSELIGR